MDHHVEDHHGDHPHHERRWQLLPWIAGLAGGNHSHFEAGKCAEIAGLISDSATPLVPALDALEGLLYYHASVDENTNTVVNVSVWESEEGAKQMDKLAAMLAQRPILEAAGVTFDRIANYKPLWKIEKDWAYPEQD